jgi:hypothetical protein
MGWRSKGPCKVCGEENCYAHCDESEDGKHAYKPGSILAREDGAGDDYVIVDLNCKNCGQSGSCVLELNEDNINW